jgi:hypothetical protein
MAVRIVRKPVARRSGRGIVWVFFGTGLLGGFFLGAVLGGWAEDSVIEAAVASISAFVVSIGLLRLPVGPIGLAARIAVFVSSWAGASLIGYGARESADLRYMDQIRAWFSTFETKAGIVLLLIGLGLAVMLSFRRPADRPEGRQ